MQLVWDDDKKLEFVRNGKTYTVREPGFRQALTIQAIQRGEDVELDGEGHETWRLVLGYTYDELVTDNVPQSFFTRVALASMAYFIHGDEQTVERIFAGSLPEAPAAPEAAETTTERPTPSRRTGEARTTKRRASTSGTRKSQQK